MKHCIKYFIQLNIILFAVILFGCSGTSPQYSTYQTQLKNQIKDMSDALNAGHYNEFMSNYVDPAYISSMGGVNQALLKFGNDRQQGLYKALKAARDVTPLYDEKGKVMTYILPAPIQPVIFKMVNGQWYLTSDWFK